MSISEKRINKFLDKVLDKAENDYYREVRLRTILVDHVLCHPWADEDFVTSCLENIGNEYGVTFENP